jgi:iron complex transport system substrate-binding protein
VADPEREVWRDARVASLLAWIALVGHACADGGSGREPGAAAVAEPWRRLALRDGTVVELAQRPLRIVSQSLATDEVLLALPLGERLIAVSALVDDPRYSLVVGAASEIERRVANSAEEILALRPDLIFVASYTTPETVDQLRRAGAPVIQIRHFDGVDDIRDNLRTIGRAVGEEAAVEARIAELERGLAAARARGRERPGRPLRVVAWEAGVVIAGGTTFSDLLVRLGTIDVAAEAGLTGWPRVGLEQIAAWRPDLIIVPAAPGTEDQATAILRAHPALVAIGLDRPGRVVALPSALFNTVSHRLGVLAQSLAELVVAAPAGSGDERGTVDAAR